MTPSQLTGLQIISTIEGHKMETTEKKLSRTNLLKKLGKRKVSKHLGSKKPKNIEEIKRKAKAAKRNRK